MMTYTVWNRFLFPHMMLKIKVIMLLLGISSITLIILNICGILDICVTDDKALLQSGSDVGFVKDSAVLFYDDDVVDTANKV